MRDSFFTASLLEQHIFSALIVSLNEEGPVAVSATACGVELAQSLHSFFVRGILLKPFKVREVILIISLLDGKPDGA